MAIFIDRDTRLVVQGITGRDGSFHTYQMMEYGTQVVAGVTPGKGGQRFDGPDGRQVPIFNTMGEAVAETGANTSVIYVPPAFAAGAIMEAADAGVALVGLSKIRETSTFGGVPIAERADELRCGVGVVDLAHGQTIATFEFVTGVDEIFDVCLLAGVRGAALRGPHAHDDGHGEIWVVPQPDHAAPSPES